MNNDTPNAGDDSVSSPRRAGNGPEAPGGGRDPDVAVPGEADLVGQLHELQVHQRELETRHRELQEEREKMAALIHKYTDLYEYAPVGYFFLDESSRILQVNRTGAALLGWERKRLVERPFLDFVVPASRPVLQWFLERVFAGADKIVCEVLLLRADGSTSWCDLQSAAPVGENASLKCHVAVSDVSALKRADELVRTNAELQKEVERRLVVEASLRQSKEELGQLLTHSHQMAEQMRLLSHHLVLAQEEERNRISRELHDDIVQTLFGIQVQLQTLVGDTPLSSSVFNDRISRTQRLVGKSVERVLTFARDLRPATLDDLGLVATLQTHFEQFSKLTKIPVFFEPLPRTEPDSLGNLERTALFRVAQAALANVARHAHASRVEVRLWEDDDTVFLEIRDNGTAFEVNQGQPLDGRKRLGLLGMRERLTMVGGALRLNSTPGIGTTIRAEVPKHGHYTPWEAADPGA